MAPAFAYGIEDGADVCEPVSLVTGPGNIYVAAAKRLLKGVIGILSPVDWNMEKFAG